MKYDVEYGTVGLADGDADGDIGDIDDNFEGLSDEVTLSGDADGGISE